MVDHFKAAKKDLALDINHASEILAPKGGDAPAQAWIQELEVRDGQVWGKPDWNADGAANVTSKRYRYVSPAMLHTKDGVIFGLSSAALVTHPALVMPALARSEGANPEDQPTMKTLAERLREAFGLAADATDDAIVTAAGTQVSLARDARDPTKLVPKADLDAALTRAQTAETSLAAIQKDAAEKVATNLIEGAISEGKIAPASKDHWVSLARADLAGTTAVVAGLPKILDPTKLAKDPAATGNEHGLTDEQVSLCAQMGLDQKAFAATLKEQA